MSRCRFIAFLFIVAIAAPGCSSKVRHNETVKLAAGDTKTFTIDGPKKEQKVKIEVTSSANISIDVILEKDKGKKPLDGKLNVKEYTFEATIPAGEAFSVIINANKEAEVTVRINSVGS